MGTIDGEAEWGLVAQMRTFLESQDPSAKETDNYTLRRFLRARGLDIEKGSSLFLKYLKWRRHAVPNGFISESEIQNELTQRKLFMQGLDKAGRPILVGFAAKHDYSKRQIDEYRRKFARLSLLFRSILLKMPTGNEKFICIADYKGWTYLSEFRHSRNVNGSC